MVLVILTWKSLMTFYVIVSDSLGRKAMHISALRRKYSSKVIESIDILLAIGLISLTFADGGVNQRQWRQALQDKIDLLNRVLSAELLLIRKRQGIGVSTFGWDSRMSLVNFCSCFRTKNLRSVFDQSCWQKHSQL